MFKNTLKRLGAIVMVLAMAMSVMMVSAFATDANTDMRAFAKTYSNTAVQPAEALSYQVDSKSASDYTNSGYATASNIPNVTVAKLAGNSNFNITLPTYNGIGKFTYNMSEVAGDTAGVTYNAAKITVVVLRTWKDINGEKTEANINTIVKIQNEAGTAKVNSVQNTFDTGSLTVTKALAGDFANPNYKFAIKVTLSAPTDKVVRNTIKVNGVDVAASEWQNGKYETTVNLKGGESATFTNLPAGVTYEVTEANQDGHSGSVDYNNGGQLIEANDTDAVTVTNTKSSSPVTGVIMNIAPYVLMVALAGGIAFFFLRRRHAE